MKMTNRWMVLFLVLPHLSIYFLNLVKTITLAWQFGIVFLAAIIITRSLRPNKFISLMIINMVIILISAMVKHSITLGIVFTIVVFISFCIYFSYAIRDFKELITGLYYMTVIVVLGNFVSLFFPVYSGGEEMYFLGGKNQFSMAIVLVIAVTYIYSLTVYKKVKPFPLFIILLGMINTYAVGSGTGIVVSLLLAIFVFSPIRKFPPFGVYLLSYIVVFTSVVIYRLHEVWFGNFIVNYLGKDLTFTNRTYIWDLVIEKAKDSILLGEGRGNTLILEGISYLRVNEAHNGFLQIVLESGVLGLFSFLLVIIIVGKKLTIYKNHRFSPVLSFSIFVFMIIGLTESAFYRKEFWILLILAYGIKQISEQVNQIDLVSNISSMDKPKRKRIRIRW